MISNTESMTPNTELTETALDDREPKHPEIALPCPPLTNSKDVGRGIPGGPITNKENIWKSIRNHRKLKETNETN